VCRWILPFLLGAAGSRTEAPAQPVPLPPTVVDRPVPGELVDRLMPPLPPAPEPVPGPVSAVAAGAGARDSTIPESLPINLTAALQLAGVRPLDIAAATFQVEQSQALLLQAKVLWVPNINGGVDYYRHDGVIQNFFNGSLLKNSRQTFVVGGGPNLFVGLADAIYSPLAARRVVSSRQADLQAARNDALLTVAQAFFDLQAARGRLLGIGAAITRAELLVNFAEGLAPSLIAPLEINRARTELQTLLQTRQADIRDWRVASAGLAEVLLLDPATLLQPIESPFLQVTLVPCTESSDALTAIALQNRPEIASRRELLAAAFQLLRQEKSRPLLPNLVVVSPATTTALLAAGNLSAGLNQNLGANGARFDIEVAAVWQLQNGGVGNIGRIRQRRAEQQVASVELTRTLFRVRSEVAQAAARMQTARVRVGDTEEGVRQAIESADKNFIGLRETTRPAGELLRLVVRPQEVVQAIAALNTAYEQYAAAVNEYNVAQFEVYRALGQPAQWVTSRAVAGPPLP
jgi:outer membrane protein TolC